MDLLVAAPREGGRALVAEVYSPHLDMHQRLLILETVAAAATRMASLQTPPFSEGRALPDRARTDSVPLPDQARLGRTRIYAPRALAKLRQAQAVLHRNR